MDTIGPLPPDDDGNTYVIAAVDGFSRFTFIRPARDEANAKEAARFLLELSGIFGLPSYFRTDNGSQYSNHLIEALLELVGTERYPGIPYRPQSNSLIERQNKEIIQHLRFIVHSRRVKQNWSHYLPLVQRIINASYNTSLGAKPCQVVFGNRVNLDRNLIADCRTNGNASSKKARQLIATISDKQRRLQVGKYINDLSEAQRAIAEASHAHMQHLLDIRSDTGAPTSQLVPGEWVKAEWGKGRRPQKLAVLWKGPYRVLGLKTGSKSVYICQDPADQVEYKYHIERLRRYHADLTDDPSAVICLDTEEFVVDEIIDHNFPSGNRSGWDFKVRWLNLPSPEEDSWVPWVEARKLKAMDRYRQQHPELRIPAA